MNNKKQAQRIALCGIMSALSVVILFLSSVIGVGTYAGPLIASLALIPLLDEYGAGTALTAFFAVGFISFMLLPDRELALFYLCFAWYPVGLTKILVIKSRAIRIVIELAIYSAIIYVMYGLLTRLFGIDPGFIESAKYLNMGLAVAGAFAFLLLVPIYTRIMLLWRYKWRNKLMK